MLEFGNSTYPKARKKYECTLCGQEIKKGETYHRSLKFYQPLDYDEWNDTYIFDLENGKRLIADYERMVFELSEKIKKKIAHVMVERKKAELERLQRELEGKV